MSNKNTNPGGGKTAVPADINNAQPAYFPKPHHTWEGQRPRCPCGGESGSGDARRKVTQSGSEILWKNRKYENFSDGMNLHPVGVACMVL